MSDIQREAVFPKTERKKLNAQRKRLTRFVNIVRRRVRIQKGLKEANYQRTSLFSGYRALPKKIKTYASGIVKSTLSIKTNPLYREMADMSSHNVSQEPCSTEGACCCCCVTQNTSIGCQCFKNQVSDAGIVHCAKCILRVHPRSIQRVYSAVDGLIGDPQADVTVSPFSPTTLEHSMFVSGLKLLHSHAMGQKPDRKTVEQFKESMITFTSRNIASGEAMKEKCPWLNVDASVANLIKPALPTHPDEFAD